MLLHPVWGSGLKFSLEGFHHLLWFHLPAVCLPFVPRPSTCSLDLYPAAFEPLPSTVILKPSPSSSAPTSVLHPALLVSMSSASLYLMPRNLPNFLPVLFTNLVSMFKNSQLCFCLTSHVDTISAAAASLSQACWSALPDLLVLCSHCGIVLTCASEHITFQYWHLQWPPAIL